MYGKAQHRAAVSRSVGRVALVLVVLVLAGAGAIAAASAELTVCPSGCQFTTIAAAVAAAGDGDKIRVGSGIYDGGLTLAKDVTLRGEGPAATTVSGTAGSVVTVLPEASVTIEGVTITGGTAPLGAGIRNDGELTLKEVAVVRNSGSGFGAAGAVYNGAGGALSLFDSRVAENSVVDGIGGGVYNDGVALIKHSTIDQNGAEFVGAGIYNDLGATMRVFDSIVNANVSGLSAGGVENRGTLELRASQVTGNVAQIFGGGLLNEGGLELTSTDVVENSATWGGGLYNGGTAILRGSSVSGNVAHLEGGGVYNVAVLQLLGTPISGNEPEDCVGC